MPHTKYRQVKKMDTVISDAAFCQLVEKKNFQGLKDALDIDPRPLSEHIVDSNGSYISLLHYALLHHKPCEPILDYLCTHSDPNLIINDNGMTPLTQAALIRRLDLVEKLAPRTNPQLIDGDGNTPLMAFIDEHTYWIEMSLDYPNNPSASQRSTWSVFKALLPYSDLNPLFTGEPSFIQTLIERDYKGSASYLTSVHEERLLSIDTASHPTASTPKTRL